MSAYGSSGKFFNKTLYGFNNVPISATGSTGSGNINVSPYNTKSVYGYITVTGSSSSGSLTVSGSFDNTAWFKLTGSNYFSSGSLNYITFTDAVPTIRVDLRNDYTGSSVSGSLYLVSL